MKSKMVSMSVDGWFPKGEYYVTDETGESADLLSEGYLPLKRLRKTPIQLKYGKLFDGSTEIPAINFNNIIVYKHSGNYEKNLKIAIEKAIDKASWRTDPTHYFVRAVVFSAIGLGSLLGDNMIFGFLNALASFFVPLNLIRGIHHLFDGSRNNISNHSLSEICLLYKQFQAKQRESGRFLE